MDGPDIDDTDGYPSDERPARRRAPRRRFLRSADELRAARLSRQKDEDVEVSEDLISDVQRELADLKEEPVPHKGKALPSEEKRKPRAMRTKRTRKRGDEGKPTGTRFKGRLLTALLGAAAVIGAQILAHRRALTAEWATLVSGVEGRPWTMYLAMGGMLFGAALVCGIVAAIMDRSAVRAFFLGGGWCALFVLGMLVWRVAAPGTSDAWPVPARMAEAALNPVHVDLVGRLEQEKTESAETKAALQEQLAEQRATAEQARVQVKGAEGELARLRKDLPDRIREARKEGVKAGRAELQPTLDRTERDLKAARARLAEAEQARAGTQEALAGLRKRVKDLEAALKAARGEPQETSPPSREPTE